MVAHIKTQKGETDMTREMMNSIKRNKQEAAELVRFANPKSKTRPTIERINEIMMGRVPYAYSEGKPVITNITVKEYNRNRIIKSARFIVTLANGKVWEITAYEHLKGRTPEEREADKTANYPSGLFRIFHDEITEKMNGGGEPAPTETKAETKTVEFKQTTKGYIGEVNGVTVWFIRDEPRLKPNEGWFIYKSADGGDTFKLIPAECTRDENGDVDFSKHHVFGFNTLQAAKAFVYKEEFTTENRKAG